MAYLWHRIRFESDAVTKDGDNFSMKNLEDHLMSLEQDRILKGYSFVENCAEVKFPHKKTEAAAKRALIDGGRICSEKCCVVTNIPKRKRKDQSPATSSGALSHAWSIWTRRR